MDFVSLTAVRGGDIRVTLEPLIFEKYKFTPKTPCVQLRGARRDVLVRVVPIVHVCNFQSSCPLASQRRCVQPPGRHEKTSELSRLPGVFH